MPIVDWHLALALLPVSRILPALGVLEHHWVAHEPEHRLDILLRQNRLTEAQMEKLVENDPERIKLVRQVIGKDVEFPVKYPATWHNTRRDHHTKDRRVPAHLRLDRPGHAKSFKDFLNRTLSNLKRYAGNLISSLRL